MILRHWTRKLSSLCRYWGISVEEVSRSLAGNVFMLGMGGLATVILSAYFGRLSILFWFTIAAFLWAIWCAASKTFDTFEAGRIVNGFFATVAQAVCSDHFLPAVNILTRIHRAASCGSKIFLPSSTRPQNQHLGSRTRHIPVSWPFARGIYGEFCQLEMAILGCSPSKSASF